MTGPASGSSMMRLQTSATGRTAMRRKVNRRPARAVARLASSTGASGQGTIADLSTHGCCIRSDASWLRLGSFVSIAIGEEEVGIQAIVRWLRDGSVGLEFLRPVAPERTEWHELMDSPFFD